MIGERRREAIEREGRRAGRVSGGGRELEVGVIAHREPDVVLARCTAAGYRAHRHIDRQAVHAVLKLCAWQRHLYDIPDRRVVGQPDATDGLAVELDRYLR